MILASQGRKLTSILLHKGVGPVSANVVMSPDPPLAILDKEEWETSFGDSDEITLIA